MTKSGFGGNKSADPASPGGAPSADDEFKALLAAAKEQADAGAAKKNRTEGAASVSRPFPKIKLGRLSYFYLAAAVVWLLGVFWLATLNATPGLWQLALTQLPVAGIIVAAHWRRKKA